MGDSRAELLGGTLLHWECGSVLGSCQLSLQDTLRPRHSPTRAAAILGRAPAVSCVGQCGGLPPGPCMCPCSPTISSPTELGASFRDPKMNQVAPWLQPPTAPHFPWSKATCLWLLAKPDWAFAPCAFSS